MCEEAPRPLPYPTHSLGFYEHFYPCSLVVRARASSSNTYILPPPRRCFSYLALEANKKFLFDLEIEKKAVTATFFEDHDCWSQRREDTHGLKSKIELHLARITPRQQQQISGQDRITMSRINLSTGERIRIRLANTSISTPTMRLSRCCCCCCDPLFHYPFEVVRQPAWWGCETLRVLLTPSRSCGGSLPYPC